MASDREFVLGVVGGASGVGKTTLLNAIAWLDRVNTGDLFKRHMSLANRDDIRSSNWAQFESDVGLELAQLVREKMFREQGLVIDTHFAAKLNGENYRIGLSRNEIFKLATAIVKLADESGFRLRTHVVHIGSDPSALLTRRRLDTSRKRELVPSDCVRALTRNEECSGQYLFEFARAYNAAGQCSRRSVDLHHILNNDLDTATKAIKAVFLEAKV